MHIYRATRRAARHDSSGAGASSPSPRETRTGAAGTVGSEGLPISRACAFSSVQQNFAVQRAGKMRPV